MTFSELNFFAKLGSMLGYHARREMNYQYPRDLCWCDSVGSTKNDIDARTYLYLERENEDSRVISNTIQKMLNPLNAPNVPNLLAVFGWIRPETLCAAKQYVRENFKKHENKHEIFSIISWIGVKKDADVFNLECWIYTPEFEYLKDANPFVDGNGFWHISLKNDGWSKKTSISKRI
jgi:hypothetical protein